MTKDADLSISIRWFPPSWLLIQYADKAVYIDPAWIQKNFAKYPKRVIYSHYPEPMDGLPEPDLPLADFIFVTHHHQDHIKTATIERLVSSRTGIYAPRRCAKLIGRSFVEVRPGDEVEIDGIDVRVVHAYNTAQGHSTRKNHHKDECVGYVFSIGGKQIYHAGDTDLIPEMGSLGGIDVAFLPIGGTFTMDSDEAIEAALVISPKVAVPIHYLKTKPDGFEAGLGRASKAIKARVLDIGDTLTLV